jgi:Ni,Fe-hydrogenase III small subunit
MKWQSSFFDVTTGYSVAPIQSHDANYLIMNVHYAKRKPSITYAFGLFENENLVGVVTYGTPASSTLLRGVCGEEWASNVLELNRLVLVNNKPLEASRLVGASLQLLPKPKIVVSYADTKQSHEGIVYQATNFLYTGLSTKFQDPVVKGLEHQHHATYAHGLTNKQLIEKFGADNVYFIERSRKHRYIIFVGSKTDKKEMSKALKYKTLPYPKERISNG